MTCPRIGITTSYEDGKQILDHEYVTAIEKAGGVPVIVPMLAEASVARELARMLDGLVITGGPGIVQGLIGELPDDLPPVDAVRNQGDVLIYEAMQQKPMLGICYGMQFINARHGGTIYGDVHHELDGVIIHSPNRGGTPHALHLQEPCHLLDLFGADHLIINTHHIQAIADVGHGLRAVGFGPDGVVEAIESQDGRVIGVQFHPERMYEHTHRLFEDFVNRCRLTVD